MGHYCSKIPWRALSIVNNDLFKAAKIASFENAGGCYSAALML